jgi:hypothetical protein
VGVVGLAGSIGLAGSAGLAGVGLVEVAGGFAGGVALTFTPLFQTNLLPCLIQVYLTLFTTVVFLTGLQAVPGLTAAAGKLNEPTAKMAVISTDIDRFMPKG